MNWSRTRALGLLLALVALAAAGCGGSSSDSDSGGGGESAGNLTLVAYSTPEEAYKELIPAFNKTPEGKGVSFDQSYAASGEQSRAVEGGLPADVVEFSLEPDITRLVDAGLVDKSWNQNEYKGMVTDSVVAFIVRKGNPKNIKTWDDLVTGEVEVLEPNPFTSGSAKWNIMAAYGAQLEQGKTPEQAKEYLAKLFENVPVLDKSAREALQTFSSGKGDVLLGYENEAILAQQKGEEVDYVIPDETLLIENPIAVVNESKDPELAQKFIDFLYTPEAQEIFASKGYRPVVKGTCRAPTSSPRRPSCSRSASSAAGARSTTSSSTRRAASWPTSSSPRGRALPPTSSATAAPAPAPPAAPVSRGPRASLIPGDVLGRGIAVAYLSIIALIPLAAVLFKSFDGGWDTFWNSISSPQAVAALRLTLIASVIVVLVNALFGTLIAWVLVRDEFPGKGIVNSLIDLPFALPTIVAGLTLLAFYGPDSPVGIDIAFSRVAVVVALLFVTLPFVVRAVQPVLLELDREMEQAAESLGASRRTVFLRIILPNLAPAIIAGGGLAFARAVGEFGSLVLITGNIPFKTQAASVFIFSQVESDNTIGAAAVSVLLLVIALVVLLFFGWLSKKALRHEE